MEVCLGKGDGVAGDGETRMLLSREASLGDVAAAVQFLVQTDGKKAITGVSKPENCPPQGASSPSEPRNLSQGDAAAFGT